MNLKIAAVLLSLACSVNFANADLQGDICYGTSSTATQSSDYVPGTGAELAGFLMDTQMGISVMILSQWASSAVGFFCSGLLQWASSFI